MNLLIRYAQRLPRAVTAFLAAAAIAVGVVLIIHPTTALGVLALLIGAGLVLAGLLELLFPVAGSERMRVLLASALVITGVVVLVLPGLTVRVLALVVGVALIVRGAVGAGALIIRRDRTLDRRIAESLLGLAGIAFGTLAIVWPDITLLIVSVVFGATLAIAGIAGLIRKLHRRRELKASRETITRRWVRTIAAVCAVALVAGTVVASATLREGTRVTDDFYAAPRTVAGEPGQLIRAEEFATGVPSGASAWRILYTTTHGDGRAAIASGIVVVPDAGAQHPVVAWHHGSTGFDRACAPSLAPQPFKSGGLYVLDDVLEHGWALVATDYIGLGTEGPHPYMVGEDSARAELDAVRAARQLDDAKLGGQTVAWGHSQGGAASLWSAAIESDYAPDVPLDGAVALAPASDLTSMVDGVFDVPEGSVFAAFVISAYSEIYPDVSFSRYVRADAEVSVRELVSRCLDEPPTLVSILTLFALSQDPSMIARDPDAGPLGARLAQNVPPAAAVPVLIGQGGDDELVLFGMQSDYANQLCADGATIDFRAYGGLRHHSLIEADSPAMEEAVAWTSDRFAGTEPYSTCR